MYNFKLVSNVDNFGFFTHLNAGELRSILNDESKLEELVNDMKQCKVTEKEKEMLLVSNRSLAEYNLSKEPQLILSKKQLLELNELYSKLYKTVERKYSGSSSGSGICKLETYLSFLQLETQEMEKQSENIAKSFFEGTIGIEKFSEKFMQTRKSMHLNKVKTDKMNEIIGEQLNFIRNNSATHSPSHWSILNRLAQ